MSDANDQALFNRDCTLQITDLSGAGLDLSDFRIVFSVEAADVDHPNTAVIRVYNLQPDTVNRIQKEFTAVSLQAGYKGDGPFGVIFVGTIKQLRKGKENATRSFVDLLCSDGDIFVNQGFMNQAFARGNTPAQAIAAAIAAGNQAVVAGTNGTGTQAVTIDPSFAPNTLINGTLQNPRGKVYFGPVREALNTLASSLQCSWSIQNGVFQIIPFNRYKPTDAIVMSQFTGVVGIPEVTNEGISITCLLNPRLTIGGTVKLDNQLINTIVAANGNVVQDFTGLNYRSRTDVAYIAKTNLDGLYRIYAIEYEGDTRGQKWYAHLTCLSTSGAPGGTVITNPTGGQ